MRGTLTTAGGCVARVGLKFEISQRSVRREEARHSDGIVLVITEVEAVLVRFTESRNECVPDGCDT
jgi:hypothetical protein